MVSVEGCPEPGRHARAALLSKRRFLSVTRTVISPAPGLAGGMEAHAVATSATAPAANPAADILRKSRLVLSVDIFLLHQIRYCELESHACQIPPKSSRSNIGIAFRVDRPGLSGIASRKCRVTGSKKASGRTIRLWR